ncbi:MAG: alcohol dehydrogenase catalytic domain-containing protein, partial [Bacilli bacterium]
MRAIGTFQPLPIEDDESIVAIELPEQPLGPNDLRVAVRAIAVNPIDTKLRINKSTARTVPLILGWDAAGVVIEAGEQCTRFRIGDEVYYSGAVNRLGAASEWHVVDERLVGHKPTTLSFAEAASLPLTSLTAWESLFERLLISRLVSVNSPETKLLIIGAAGGVGSMAIQLAKLCGIQVIATASRPESAAWCKEMGADTIISHALPLRPQLEA